ncbi:MAG: hypothetical protein KA109_12015 [Saprospiraceae bacterium]|nr:hypothetical protein [Saprospiraceae bacterium]MBK7605972.1 hypothetical protein [Saprospiraceae bacterium]MBP7802340.1 hypothetical protein [Saprospiraceae bacterium]MBP7924564.1 hypothetical protein [Saprospiraceae bacterium]MBP8095439.1 hypothetical protein [Saprospiraceae bacterium]
MTSSKSKPTKGKLQGISAIARISIVKDGNSTKSQIQEIISKQSHSISYSPIQLSVNGRQYVLKYPLRCLLEKEEDFYIIKNEFLDLIGTGVSTESAEANFNEEFDFLYHRLNTLKKAQLSSRLAEIKQMMNYYVASVI